MILRGAESLGKETRGRVADSELPLKLEMGQLLGADRKSAALLHWPIGNVENLALE